MSTAGPLSEKSINVLYTRRQPIDWLHSLTEESETRIFVTFIVITACDRREEILLCIVGKCAVRVNGSLHSHLPCHGSIGDSFYYHLLTGV